MTTYQEYRSSIALSTDNSFRSFGSWISNAMASVGCVKSSDTGQINWTTVSRPTATGSDYFYAGYEVWRLADALDSTYPLYVRIQYGVYGTGYEPAYIFSVGPSTNGSGSLGTTYWTSGNLTITGWAGSEMTLSICRSRGSLFFNMSGTASRHVMFGAYRSQDSTGQEGPHVGIMRAWGNGLAYYNPTVSCTNRNTGATRSATAASTTTNTGYVFVPYPSLGSGTNGQRTVTMPVFSFPTFQACDGMLMTRGSEFTVWSTFTAAPLGTTRTYMVLPLYYSSANVGYLATVWE